MKLQNKISIILLPFIFSIIALVGYIAFVQLKQVAQDRSLEAMVNTLERHTDTFETLYETAESNTKLLSNSIFVRKYFQEEDEIQQMTLFLRPLLGHFSNFQNAYPQYREMRV